MAFTGWVNHCGEEIFLHDFSGVNVFESSNLSSELVVADLDQFLTQKDLNASLAALVKCNLVGVWEFEDLLVGGPVLNFGIFGSSALDNVLIDISLVVKWIEVSSLSLVGELRGVTEHISVRVVPSVVVVPLQAYFIIDLVNEDTVLTSVLLELWESLNVFR